MDQALASVMDRVAPLPSAEQPVNEKLIGAVLDEDVVAVEAVPGYRASILDGYAVIGNVRAIGHASIIGVFIQRTITFKHF